MTLTEYKKKRNFQKTPEPTATISPKGKMLHFVVQKHAATHLHYDFRLEFEGVLKSWAVPKGPSMNAGEKRLAVAVEDHPLAYRTFHGTIPKGEYGAGTVEIWDEGTYELLEHSAKNWKVVLHGKKLNGKFDLVQFGAVEKNWLLFKSRDEFAAPAIKEQISEGKKSEIPRAIKPMLAELAEKPFSDPNWIFEIKWDGYRAIAEIEKGKVRLYSRNNQDFTHTYAQIAEAMKGFEHDMIFDGEIVGLDKEGISQFQLLQDYRTNKNIMLVYYVFDILYLDGRDLRELPLMKRKEILKSVFVEKPNVKMSDYIEEKGKEFFDLAIKKNIEGIMAKRKDSPYVPYRSDMWLKIKHVLQEEAVVCGFTEPRGTREEFGALILGKYNKAGKLTYVGHTGGGFDEKKLKDMKEKLAPLIIDTCPFETIPETNAPATWVSPKIVVQVKFSQWTKEGIMRMPIFLGIREDKPAKEVREVKKVNKPISQKAKFSNIEKVFWPKEQYTKGDVISYYSRISDIILPYLKDRPESLNRHPNGITGKSFYQKDLLDHPPWVKTIAIRSDTEKKDIHWLICNDKETLLYMANLGCIELNPWNARYQTPDNPDYLILDLDPNNVPFAEAVEAAIKIQKIFEKTDIAGFIKTSGKRGLHILVPLGAKYSFDESRQFAEILANIIQQELPESTSIKRNPERREKKVYIDFLQNRRGQTLSSAYSLRPVPGANVSTPIQWGELTPKLSPQNFTIKNIFERLDKKGDVWKLFLTHRGIDMLKSLTLLEQVKK